MITLVELDLQDPHHGGGVVAAVDGMPPGDLEQCRRGVGAGVEGRTDLGLPRLGDPLHDGERQILFAGELVIERAPGVAGLLGHGFERQPGVAVASDAPCGGLRATPRGSRRVVRPGSAAAT